MLRRYPSEVRFQVIELARSGTRVVRLIDKLETNGLVERKCAADRRAVALHLTPAGRQRAAPTVHTRRHALEQIVITLSPAQQRHLDVLAHALLSAMTTSPIGAAHLCRLCDEPGLPTGSMPSPRTLARARDFRGNVRHGLDH